VMFALLFRRLQQWLDLLVVVGLSLPMVVLYPTVVLLAPALAGVALWRWRRRAMERFGAVWIALAIWFVIVAAVAVLLIIEPRDAGNRDGFLAQIRSLAFLYVRGEGVNWPLSLFRGVLAGGSGLMPFEQTPLAQQRIGLQAVRPLGWAWTDPLLSIVLAPHGQVAAIVSAPSTVGWQPFDPSRPDDLPPVPGIDYSRYREALAAGKAAAPP